MPCLDGAREECVPHRLLGCQRHTNEAIVVSGRKDEPATVQLDLICSTVAGWEAALCVEVSYHTALRPIIATVASHLGANGEPQSCLTLFFLIEEWSTVAVTLTALGLPLGLPLGRLLFWLCRRSFLPLLSRASRHLYAVR